jgi:TctA family transporter
MQMAAGGLGVAIIPSLVGVLARRSSLEIIPICLTALFVGLFFLQSLSAKLRPKPAFPKSST